MAVTINASTSAGLVQTADTTGELQLQTANTTAVTINTSQNVGIGTTSPSYKLQIFGATNPEMRLGDAVVTYQLYTEGATAAVMGTVGNHSLVYRTNATERMRVDATGTVLVGATDYVGSGVTRAGIAMFNQVGTFGRINVGKTVSGTATAMQLNHNGSEVGTITYTNTGTSYVTTSDYRIKENVAPMTGALNKVAQLKPVTYTWKVDGSDGQGFIAHELQAIVPDCVSGEKDAVETYTDEDGIEQTRPVYQGIDTSFLVATLTAAIQEQQTIINDLTARVTALEGAA
jgi:hypothetical protein